MSATTTELALRDKPLSWRIRNLAMLPLLLVAGLPVEAMCAQQTTIHRCIGSNGEPTFRDRECDHALQAQPSDTDSPAGPGLPSGTINPPTQTCPVSADDLLRRARAAFDSKQAVAFSGLILWNGMGQGSSIAALRELAVLVSEPLLSMDLEYEAWADFPQSRQPRFAREAPPALGLVVRTVSEHDNQVPFESVLRFDVADADGCWWLLMPW